MTGIHLGDPLPELLKQAIRLNHDLMPIAIILATFGIIAYAIKGMNGDIGSMIHGLAAALIVAILIPTLPDIANTIQLATYSLVEEMGANPSGNSKKFGNLIVNKTNDGGTEVGFFDILTDSNGGVGKAFLYLILLLSSFSALVIQYLIFIVQQALTVSGIAMSPIFLTMFLLQSLRAIATKYFVGLTAILLWPLGWAFADFITTALLERAADAELYSEGSLAFMSRTVQSLFFAFTISIWLFISTIAAPYVMTKVVTTGANAGGVLFGRLGSALGLGASYGIMAGATAQMAGTSKFRAALATGAAGLGGIMSGANGGGGFLIPATIGIAATRTALKNEDSGKPTNYNEKASKIFNS